MNLDSSLWGYVERDKVNQNYRENKRLKKDGSYGQKCRIETSGIVV